MSQTTPSHDSGESKNSADNEPHEVWCISRQGSDFCMCKPRFCRACVFTDHRANPHWCEGGTCSCEGVHVAQACGEIMSSTRQKDIDTVPPNRFL